LNTPSSSSSSFCSTASATSLLRILTLPGTDNVELALDERAYLGIRAEQRSKFEFAWKDDERGSENVEDKRRYRRKEMSDESRRALPLLDGEW